ncbi:MAG: glutamate--tRNA ligase [Candidatus Helarchaeota archaeon]
MNKITDDEEVLIERIALENAIKYNGNAQLKAVISKLIILVPNLKKDLKTHINSIKSIVERVNGLSLEKQKDRLSVIKQESINIFELKNGLILNKDDKWDHPLPPLPNAEYGKVITRFPPEPNGYLHIGHAKAAIIDYTYAKIYNGKFILRFDDTNPKNESKEYYDIQKEDLKWLGIKWDIEYRTSDNINKHYNFAESLIDNGFAYVCNCSPEKVKMNRSNEINCNCRNNSSKENLHLWENMLDGTSKGILRLKGNMQSKNTAMRDPTLFRVLTTPHPIHGTKYNVWPTYDMAAPIEDSISGVTHPFRTKEYELRDEVYFTILNYLNLRKPNLMAFSRLEMRGFETSKRKLKHLIKTNKVSGWDDPRLLTLRGLDRRGIVPKAIREFIFNQGISKVESKLSLSLLESINRKIIDPTSKRFFFVPYPKKIFVKNAPHRVISLKNHPKSNLGVRKIKTNSNFYISNLDLKNIKDGDIFRLKNLYNIKLVKKNDSIFTEYISDDLIKNNKKIQWVTEDNIPCSVLIPGLLVLNGKPNDNSLKIIDGLAEKSLFNEKIGTKIQFERFGFVKIDKIIKSKIECIFTHISYVNF